MAAATKPPGIIERIEIAPTIAVVRDLVADAGTVIQNPVQLKRINRVAARRVKQLSRP